MIALTIYNSILVFWIWQAFLEIFFAYPKGFDFAVQTAARNPSDGDTVNYFCPYLTLVKKDYGNIQPTTSIPYEALQAFVWLWDQ
ncbi:hypothetical protein ACQFX9_29235 [Aliinostoc sp. HNIBRCY26]|uniref:hypothetical protein n=1 Tax=Aliinostoc sp. HNIBRCY26 TaxID=3418997 RepID=UPI003D05B6B1